MIKKLTYRLLLFVTLLFLLDQAVAYYFDDLYAANYCNYSNGEINDYIDNKSCDTLYIGSSRVLHMIVPEVLGPASMTLAKQRKHLYHNTCLVDILQTKNSLPKRLLVFNFEVEDLYLKSEERLLNGTRSLKYYYDKNDLVKRVINKIGLRERIKYLSSSYRHNGEGWRLISFPLEGNCRRYPEDGYLPLMPGENDSIRLARSLVDDFQPYNFEEISPFALELLLHVKSICEQSNIDLKIINAPYYKYHPEFVIATAYMKKFCTENDIYYQDFNESNIPELDDKAYWYDNMHLNSDGAIVYSQYLKETLFKD